MALHIKQKVKQRVLLVYLYNPLGSLTCFYFDILSDAQNIERLDFIFRVAYDGIWTKTL